MKKLFSLLLAAAMLLTLAACGTKNADSSTPNTTENPAAAETNTSASTEEVETYMRLLLEQPDSEAKRLRMMEEKRNETLDELHFHERQLQRLDYLRHEIQKQRKG